MTWPPPIAFEPDLTDVVTAVLIPIDGATRRPVRSGISAQLWDPVGKASRPNRIVRNLSGHLVLLNEPLDTELTFRIDPEGAGYRGPVFRTFTPVETDRSRIVALERRADAYFDPTETLIRGGVVRSADPAGIPGAPAPVAGLTVSARPPAGAAGHQFPVTTDERGVFALVVGLRLVGTNEGPISVPTRLRFEKTGLPVRELSVNLDPGRVHVFTKPIDLDTDRTPVFSHH
jgi:hypothetical protein